MPQPILEACKHFRSAVRIRFSADQAGVQETGRQAQKPVDCTVGTTCVETRLQSLVNEPVQLLHPFCKWVPFLRIKQIKGLQYQPGILIDEGTVGSDGSVRPQS